MSEQILLFSHSLDQLVDELANQLALTTLFSSPLIIIPHLSMKEWLQIELAKRAKNRGVAALHFATWQQGIQRLTEPLPTPSRAELFAAIWIALKEEPPIQCQPFLATQRKMLDFANRLAAEFWEGSLYGFVQEESWQKLFFDKIFKIHHWLPLYLAIEQAPIDDSTPLFLFGIDFLPSAVHQFFWKHPTLNVFRFSPCAMFWEDIRSVSEQKSILRQWKRKRVSLNRLESLEGLLREGQPLLANWGFIGRKMLGQPIEEEVQVFENYELRDKCKAALHLIQEDFLLLQTRESTPLDDSIQLIQAGASKLREIELLRDEVIRLAANGFSFSEVRVYAPDIDVYAPLIQFVFSDPIQSIPFRIAGLNLSCQSPFYQALTRLFDCVTGRWSAKDLLVLFENPSFACKASWKEEDLEQLRSWVEYAHVRWGIDGAHRNEIGAENVEAPTSSLGSWEEGFDRLIDGWLFLRPEREDFIQWSNADLFQHFCNVFHGLRSTLAPWKRERSLKEWADEISELATAYLVLNEDLESDTAAHKDFFRFLETLRHAQEAFPNQTFPFSWVRTLFSPSTLGTQGRSLLHGVSFASLEPGAVLPARALFLIGLDEESFPRAPSFLRSTEAPQQNQWDRYLFLEAVFAAKERLIFSYCHRSKEDGKAVSPSLLIQELYSYLNASLPEVAPPASSIDPRCFTGNGASLSDYHVAQAALSPTPHALFSNMEKVPDEAMPSHATLTLGELNRFMRHPWQNYLQEIVGLEFKEESESEWKDFEFSPLFQHRFLQKALQGQPIETGFPLGLLGEEAKRSMEEKVREYKARLREWNISSMSERKGKLVLKWETSTIRLIGSASLAVPDGLLYIGDDSIRGMLRRWPELLFSLAYSETRRIYCMRSGRVREVIEPLSSLQAIVELYYRCRFLPLFLHPDWADELLRKGVSPDRDCDDPLLEWTLERSSSFDLQKEQITWRETLEKTFTSLISLFPTRKSRGAHAEV
ncbi:MAG: exodeoxyribonuclease V subunit gamma [Verrucomicrobiota bacterium]|nr:exodeoxyribonuclease V subunit gamma [Verrucomicrobiota bacterium]